jgi:hypothetical protein
MNYAQGKRMKPDHVDIPSNRNCNVYRNPSDPGATGKYGVTLRNLQMLSESELHQCGIFAEPTMQTIEDLTFDQSLKLLKCINMT